jgi:hypothetical protein
MITEALHTGGTKTALSRARVPDLIQDQPFEASSGSPRWATQAKAPLAVEIAPNSPVPSFSPSQEGFSVCPLPAAAVTHYKPGIPNNYRRNCKITAN